MAKRRPHVTLLEMEKELGFQVEVTSDDIHEEERFYSDLSPLSKKIYTNGLKRSCWNIEEVNAKSIK